MTISDLASFIASHRAQIREAYDAEVLEAKREYEQLLANAVATHHGALERLLQDAESVARQLANAPGMQGTAEIPNLGSEGSSPSPGAPRTRTKATCPDCGKEVERTATGLRKHNRLDGQRCAGNAGEGVGPSPATSPATEEPPAAANPHTSVDAQAGALFP